MYRHRKKYLYFIAGFFLVCYILPNVINFRERRYFSDERRLREARERTPLHKYSIRLTPGNFYDRGKAYTYFFGFKNRDLWTTPVTFPVFRYDAVKGGLRPYDSGGSQQTISIRLEDSAGRHWVARSINKDQQNVLPWWLRPTFLRPVFRDQVSAMNPYGARVVASLSSALGLPHLNPQIFWMPYDARFDEYNERIAGRLVYLEEHLDSSWRGAPHLGNPLNIIDTEELEEIAGQKKIRIDTLLYLKTRLFDMLINDWDRHKDQWRWVLVKDCLGTIYRPVARDRDIAFYVFDEGVINKLARRSNEKFQSFRQRFDAVSGLMKQSRKMDKNILEGVKEQVFVTLARQIQTELDGAAIHNAFLEYPAPIYQLKGPEHEAILKARLTQLPAVASQFWQLIQED